MFRKNKLEKQLLKNLEQLNFVLSKNRILELSELLGNKKKLLVRNLISGMAKGIGIGIGFSIITALIIYVMQKIIRLNM